MELPTLVNLLETLPPRVFRAAMATTAMRARSRPYSTMLAPRSSQLSLARIQVFRTNRSICCLLLGRRSAPGLCWRFLRAFCSGYRREQADAGWADRPIVWRPGAGRTRRSRRRLTRRRLPSKRSGLAADRVAHAVELVGDVASEGLQSGDGDHSDEGKEQAVLDHAGATLVAVELGKDPGLQNEQVHCFLPPCGAGA